MILSVHTGVIEQHIAYVKCEGGDLPDLAHVFIGGAMRCSNVMYNKKFTMQWVKIAKGLRVMHV